MDNKQNEIFEQLNSLDDKKVENTNKKKKIADVAKPKAKFTATNIACTLVSALFLFVAILLFCFRTTVLSQDFYSSKMRDDDYCVVLTEEVKKNIFKNGQTFTNAPVEVFDNGLTIGAVINASIDYCTTCFTGSVAPPSTEEIADQFCAAITKYIRIHSPNLKITNEIAQSTIDLADDCAKVYSDTIAIQVLPEVGLFSYKYASLFDTFAFIFLMLAIIAYSPIMFNYSPVYQKIRYLSFTVIAIAIMMVLTAAGVSYMWSQISVSITHSATSFLFNGAADAFVSKLWTFAAICAFAFICVVIGFYFNEFYQKEQAIKEFKKRTRRDDIIMQ